MRSGAPQIAMTGSTSHRRTPAFQVSASERRHSGEVCTTFAAAPIVDALEKRYDVPIHDSVATAVYGALRTAGGNVGDVKGFGRMFKTK
jgi:hypothetical protein